jgi:hypothetical protein
MTAWTRKLWRFAWSTTADGTLLVDGDGEWIRLFGRTWYLAEQAR